MQPRLIGQSTRTGIGPASAKEHPDGENTGIRADTREAEAVIEGTSEGSGTSELIRLAARLIIEEALEGEARDALGREYYARGTAPGAGYRNGYRRGRLDSAEGRIEYSAPQIADRAAPFRSAIREIMRGRTAELEALAVEMYARGLSTRDIEALFADGSGKSLLSRTAVSEITERLWARGICQPRLVGIRGPLSVCRWYCRAAASGPAA